MNNDDALKEVCLDIEKDRKENRYVQFLFVGTSLLTLGIWSFFTFLVFQVTMSAPMIVKVFAVGPVALGNITLLVFLAMLSVGISRDNQLLRAIRSDEDR